MLGGRLCIGGFLTALFSQLLREDLAPVLLWGGLSAMALGVIIRGIRREWRQEAAELKPIVRGPSQE